MGDLVSLPKCSQYIAYHTCENEDQNRRKYADLLPNNENLANPIH